MEEKRDFGALQDNQCIVRVLQICFPGVAVIVTPKGFKHLVAIQKTLDDDDMSVTPGNYVLIQATEEGSRYPAEVINIIDREYENYYRAHGLWPTAYDIDGYVERLAEKLQRAEAAAEFERLLKIELEKKKQKINEKKTLSSVLNSTSSVLCERYSQLKEQLREKLQLNPEDDDDDDIKTTKRDIYEAISKKTCKTDKDHINDSPIFPDIDIPPICKPPPKKIANCGINTQNTTMTCGTNTKKKTARKKYSNVNALQLKAAVSGASGCCKNSCCGMKNSLDNNRKTIGSGPYYSNLTVGRDQLPPLYGKCTPWRMTKKELKKKCEDYNNSLFTALNKEECHAADINNIGERKLKPKL